MAHNVRKPRTVEWWFYIPTSCGHYENTVGLHSKMVGMVILYVKEFKYIDNDPDNKRLYYDNLTGDWYD